MFILKNNMGINSLEKIIKSSLAVFATASLFFLAPTASAGDEKNKPSYTSNKSHSSSSISQQGIPFSEYVNKYRGGNNINNNINTRPSDFHNVLGLGVGSREAPERYKGYFDKVVPLTTGNKVADYGIAGADTFKIPVTSLKQFYGKTVDNYFAHSWHASALINEIKSGKIKVNNIILLDPPGSARDYSDLTKLGTKVTVYSANQNFFKALPETFIKPSVTPSKIKIDEGYAPKGTTFGVKWTFPLPEQKQIRNNIIRGPTNHDLEANLDRIVMERPNLLTARVKIQGQVRVVPVSPPRNYQYSQFNSAPKLAPPIKIDMPHFQSIPKIDTPHFQSAPKVNITPYHPVPQITMPNKISIETPKFTIVPQIAHLSPAPIRIPTTPKINITHIQQPTRIIIHSTPKINLQTPKFTFNTPIRISPAPIRISTPPRGNITHFTPPPRMVIPQTYKFK